MTLLNLPLRAGSENPFHGKTITSRLRFAAGAVMSREADLQKPPDKLVRSVNERRAIRSELLALAVRAREAGLRDITRALDMAMAMDPGRDWPAGVIRLPVADE